MEEPVVAPYFSQFSIGRPRARRLLPLALLLAGLCAPQAAFAGAEGCIIDDTKKVCVVLSWDPQSAQPSEQKGTETYVRFQAELRNVTAQSSRFLTVNFALSPATRFDSYEASPQLSCSLDGAALNCAIDKLQAGEVLTIAGVAATPSEEGTLTNTVTYGWQGRTASLSGSVPISASSGESWQQPDKEVRLSTHKPNADPSQQTTPQDPIYGEVTIPPSPTGGPVFIRIVTDGPDRGPVCVGGIYLDPLADGGPFLCRDTDVPQRWVQVGTEDAKGSAHLLITVIEDDSVVQDIQLPPVPPLAPTGSPPFALFAKAEPSDLNPDPPFRAIEETCEAAAPPCLQDVQRYDTGDWTATLKTRSVDLGRGDFVIFGLLPPIGNIQ